jgi:hypothetical protein
MPAAAVRKPRPAPIRKIFHATLLVTRVEQWWIEAETADEARALLAAGEGHRDALGERVHVELEAMLEDEAA